MKTQALVLATLGLWLAGCSAEATTSPGGSKPTSRPSGGEAAASLFASDDLQVVWPEDGAKVLSTFDLVVGLEGAVIPGHIAVCQSAVAKGERPDGTVFEAGANRGEVSLAPGKQEVVIQWLEDDGTSRGPEMSHSVTYEVVEASTAPRVFFKSPADGATVSSPFHVEFGVEGMSMSKALENVMDKTVGHHHVIINKGVLSPSTVIPKDAIHIHYGDAQTEADLELEPGEYTLTMQFADGNHRSYGERMSHSIQITVE